MPIFGIIQRKLRNKYKQSYKGMVYSTINYMPDNTANGQDIKKLSILFFAMNTCWISKKCYQNIIPDWIIDLYATMIAYT